MSIDVHKNIILSAIADDRVRHTGLPLLYCLDLSYLLGRKLDIDGLDVGKDMLDFAAANDRENAMILE